MVTDLTDPFAAETPFYGGIVPLSADGGTTAPVGLCVYGVVKKGIKGNVSTLDLLIGYLKLAGWAINDKKKSTCELWNYYFNIPTYDPLQPPPVSPTILSCAQAISRRAAYIGGISFAFYNPITEAPAFSDCSVSGGDSGRCGRWVAMGSTIDDSCNHLASAMNGSQSDLLVSYEGITNSGNFFQWPQVNFKFETVSGDYTKDWIEVGLGSITDFPRGGWVRYGNQAGFTLEFGLEEGSLVGNANPFQADFYIADPGGRFYFSLIYAQYTIHADPYQFILWSNANIDGSGDGYGVLFSSLATDSHNSSIDVPVLVVGSKVDQVRKSLHWDHYELGISLTTNTQFGTGFSGVENAVTYFSGGPNPANIWRSPSLVLAGVRGGGIKTAIGEPYIQIPYVLGAEDPSTSTVPDILMGALRDAIVTPSGVAPDPGAMLGFDGHEWVPVAWDSLTEDVGCTLWGLFNLQDIPQATVGGCNGDWLAAQPWTAAQNLPVAPNGGPGGTGTGDPATQTYSPDNPIISGGQIAVGTCTFDWHTTASIVTIVAGDPADSSWVGKYFLLPGSGVGDGSALAFEWEHQGTYLGLYLHTVTGVVDSTHVTISAFNPGPLSTFQSAYTDSTLLNYAVGPLGA